MRRSANIIGRHATFLRHCRPSISRRFISEDSAKSHPSPEEGQLIKTSSFNENKAGSTLNSDIVIDVEMDTAAAVKGLVSTGLTMEQSEVIVELIRWIIFVRLDEMARMSVSRSQMDHVQEYKMIILIISLLGLHNAKGHV